MYWKAYYKDGQRVSEHGMKYTDIDRRLVVKFEICKENGERLAFIDIPDNAKLFYRKRVQMNLTNQLKRAAVFGYTGEQTRVICAFEDGEIIFADDFDTKDKWLYPVKLLDIER